MVAFSGSGYGFCAFTLDHLPEPPNDRTSRIQKPTTQCVKILNIQSIKLLTGVCISQPPLPCFQSFRLTRQWQSPCLSRGAMRHITVSTQRGMVTELELMGGSLATGERYMVRYHKSGPNSPNPFD